jgi:hypothetical protein
VIDFGKSKPFLVKENNLLSAGSVVLTRLLRCLFTTDIFSIISLSSGVRQRISKCIKFANNINESGWETSAQRRLVARICALFKAYTGGRAWKAIGDRLLKPCYQSKGDHNRKIRTRKQRTGVGIYSFVNRTIKSWNQLTAGLLASFRCKINTF